MKIEEMSDEELAKLKAELVKDVAEKQGFKLDKRDAAGAGIGALLGAGVMWLVENM